MLRTALCALLAVVALCAAPVGAQTPAAIRIGPACGGAVTITPAVGDAATSTVGVLYFAGGSTRGDDPQLAEAVTAEVVAALSRASGISVVRGDGWLNAVQTPAYVLTGHVSRTSTELSIRVRLNAAGSGSMVWNSQYTGPVLDLPRLGARIAADAARQVGALPDTTPPPPIAISLRAFDEILLGDFNIVRWDQASVRRALQSLAMGAGLSGGSPSAYARYGLALGKMGEWGYQGPAAADSLLAWGSLTSELAADRELHAGRTAPAAAGYGAAAVMSALRSDSARAATLADRTDSLEAGHPDAARARALLELPNAPVAAARRLAAIDGAPTVAVLLDQAMLALTARQDTEACRALDIAAAIDPRSAPVFALRSLVRMRNGDMRGGWADAEMAGQLGRPAWSEALELLASTRVSDPQERIVRVERYVRNVRADSSEMSVLDARLAAIALTAAGREVEARRVMARMRFSDPRRALSLGERAPDSQ